MGFGISGALPAQLAPITTGTLPPSNVTPVTTGTAAAVTTGTTAAATSDEVIQMSVFNVNSSADRGYTAMNTASGSRINTPLRDTAASISPFTQEFLQDIGATTIDDMLSYGANIETDTGDADYGFNTDIGGAATTDNGFRIRGLSMTTAMDGVETTFSQDAYNIDRAEVSSGPNSILFGMGQPGGMVTLASKRANLQRNTLKVQNIIGTWNNLGQPWNYYRATVDYNIALMPRILALRVNGMYQDGTTGANGSWRYWMKGRDKRINPSLTFKPWNNTTLTVGYEAGRTKSSLSYAWNASDRVSGWLNAGRPILEVFASTPTTFAGRLPGTQQIGNNNAFATGAKPYYVYVDNNTTLYDYRQALQSMNGIFATAAQTNDMQQLRAPADMSSYDYSTAGPGGWRDQRFDRYQFVIEQRIGNLNLQAGYYHTKNNAVSHAPAAFDASLRGDPNRYISSPDYANGGAGTTLNPNVGGLYLEDNWEMRVNQNRSEVYRLTAEYTINLQKYGRHRIIGMVEHTDSEIYNNRLSELLIDENQQAINTPTDLFPSTNNGIGNAPNGNLLNRRHYVTPGDFTTYYASDWAVPIEPFLLNGHMYHSQYVTKENNNVNDNIRTRRTIDSYTLTLQSYWFKDRLVTILGGRLDSTQTKRVQIRYRDSNGVWTIDRITDLNDPRLLDGSRIMNEAVLDGPWLVRPRKTPYTYSYGAVWHATDRLSLYGNTSTNRNSDDPYGRTVLPDGNEPAPSVGTSTDYGVMFDPLGNSKVFLRLGHFDTRQRNQLGTANQPNLKSVADRLGSIYTAMHSAGLLLDESAPAFTAGMTDAYSRGYEGELTANLTRNFTMRLTFSYTDRARENVFKEIFDYFNGKIPVWMTLADPYRNGNHQFYYNGETLYQYLLDQLYTLGSAEIATNGAAGASIRDDLSTVLTMQSGGMASRPLKVNLTARYGFQQGWLKGFAIGGSMRYASQNRMPDPGRDWLSSQEITPDDHPMDIRMDPNTYTDYATMIKGNTLLFWDAMLNYKCKLFSGRTTMTLQLNIKNLFNQALVTPGQYRRASTGPIYLRRIYLNEPRSIRLTATFDF